jgi:hypothetical protein
MSFCLIQLSNISSNTCCYSSQKYACFQKQIDLQIKISGIFVGYPYLWLLRNKQQLSLYSLHY